MTKPKLKWVKSARRHVRNLFREHKPEGAVYHDFRHTKEVVKSARRLAKGQPLSKPQRIALLLSAWFHDVGYVQGSVGHEARSAQAAEVFLNDKEADPDFIHEVRGAILATRLPQEPETLVEQILCDADLFHLGTRKFARRNVLLRKEIQSTTGLKVNKAEWLADSLALLREHRYFTPYGRKKLQKGQRRNLKKLEAKQKEVPVA
ncbi:HD domain-containing protein [Chryseolinea lacunae]|uniref:HD domain-containing protein n=1 Tax=Chryseolinea lacunae TaxID=2801331 RepID=A0ABS1KP35_9BACT|nr:HD domain-containing protein [Chryseolinea lacunae]MBL0741095.1 HD domain-containing protein [Chryseolinea lacunae]